MQTWLLQEVRPQLEAYFTELTNHWGQPTPFYSWLSPTQIASLVHLILAISHRPSGKFQQSLAHLNKGLELVDAELSRQRIIVQGVVEADLTQIALREGRPLLMLKYLLLENAAQISLTQHKLLQTQQVQRSTTKRRGSGLWLEFRF